MSSDLISAENTLSIRGIDDDLKRARDDNDPQTVFYINSTSASAPLYHSSGSIKEDTMVTLYSWATKIEHTVQVNFGKGDETERQKAQACWDRAAYRAKLLDFLAKQTPWLTMRDSQQTSSSGKLTGQYHSDKQIYQQSVHEFLKQSLSEIPTKKLTHVERYVAETMVLGQDKLDNVLRFAIVFPLVSNIGNNNKAGVRVIVFAFEQNRVKKTVEISNTMYEAGLDKNLFDQEKFDPKLLAAGKTLVEDTMLNIII